MDLSPMLATPSTHKAAEFERLIATGDWAADVKLDGIRCWAHWTGRIVTLLNRKGVNITRRFPEVVDQLMRNLADQPACLVDGEIVANDGLFTTVGTRDKQGQQRNINAMALSHPCTFYGFDLPAEKNLGWSERRARLDQIDMPKTVLSFDSAFFAQTRKLGLEGVIAKRLNGRYEFGRRSANWLKFKNLVRVSCIAYAYTPGTGSRSEFGAMQLALLDDDGTPVSVGRVGTGFTQPEINRLKRALDKGTPLVVEIECLNKTADNQLRFPSYKGVRTDVLTSECTMRQLDLIAAC